MEKWEYLTRFFEAEATDKEIKEFIKTEFEVKKPKRYAPESMIPELNKLGEEGWELVHMEPVPGIGNKGDVRFEDGKWSNVYFCSFKRRIPGTGTPVIPINYGQQPTQYTQQQQQADQYAQYAQQQQAAQYAQQQQQQAQQAAQYAQQQAQQPQQVQPQGQQSQPAQGQPVPAAPQPAQQQQATQPPEQPTQPTQPTASDQTQTTS